MKLRNSNIGCRYRSEYMGVFGYADNLSLLCPSFSGMKEMLSICEQYAHDNNIMFNASKSQLIYFGKNKDQTHTIKPPLRMQYGQLTLYAEKCIHLGNAVSSNSTERSLIDSAITELNIKTNNLLSEFSFSESSTLSRLFSSYRMNVYGSLLWRYNYHYNIKRFTISWRKAIRRLWKIPYRTHNALVHHINKCNSIVSILEKRCVKFLWNLLNSDNVSFSRMCKYSVYNWFSHLNNIYIKIEAHVHNISKLDDICVAGAVRELCEARDSGLPQFVDSNQLSTMILIFTVY